jgi:hypothetical protein
MITRVIGLNSGLRMTENQRNFYAFTVGRTI